MENTAADKNVPLCVDLDGTLIHTDMLFETLALLIKNSVLLIFKIPFWMFLGRARFKNLVAQNVVIDAENLPYRQNVLEIVNKNKAAGRKIVLVTASCEKIAKAIAEYLNIFDEVYSSTEKNNLSGRKKAEFLVEKYGTHRFDYIGDSLLDLSVFSKARNAWLVSSSSALKKKAKIANESVIFISDSSGQFLSWMKALRLHQWLKNILIFVPLISAHMLLNVEQLYSSIIAFLLFCFCASSVYVFNDIFDLKSDRLHRRKKHRPFAAGDLSIKSGWIFATILLTFSIVGAFALSLKFGIVLLAYCVVTFAYSLFLKKQVIVDVVILAGLYTIRIFAGAAATNIQLSFWLLSFSMFTFFGLAMVKRYSELRGILSGNDLEGRGYRKEDLPVIMALGASCGMVSVMILALYTQNESIVDLYLAPEWLWLVPPVFFYWTARIWMKTTRGEMHDDPVVFAIRDWQSLCVMVLIGIFFLLAMIGWVVW